MPTGPIHQALFVLLFVGQVVPNYVIQNGDGLHTTAKDLAFGLYEPCFFWKKQSYVGIRPIGRIFTWFFHQSLSDGEARRRKCVEQGLFTQ